MWEIFKKFQGKCSVWLPCRLQKFLLKIFIPKRSPALGRWDSRLGEIKWRENGKQQLAKINLERRTFCFFMWFTLPAKPKFLAFFLTNFSCNFWLSHIKSLGLCSPVRRLFRNKLFPQMISSIYGFIHWKAKSTMTA